MTKNDSSMPSKVFARPVRKKEYGASLSAQLLPYFPEIKKKLALADVNVTPQEFLERVLVSAAVLSVAALVATALIFTIISIDLYLLIPFILIYPIALFWYLMLYLDVAIIKKRKNIDYEIVFAVRHIIIALKSGMPLFDSLVGVSVGYGEISKEFNKIVEKVTLGVPLSQALRDAAQNTPSRDFARVIMQIANSLASGSDVADSMEAVLNQISKDQVIALQAYGRKLTPLVMFFMIFGIILPSLGIAFAVILLSLISGGALAIGQSSYLLVAVFAFILLVQYLFLAMVEGSRPHYAM